MSVVPMNDLSRGLARDSIQILEAISTVIQSGHLILGSQLLAFESKLSRYLSCEGTVGVASGTDALEIAIKCLMPKGKSSVLTAANAGGYTSIASKRAGYDLEYCDIDPKSLSINLKSLITSLTSEVGVVVVTHLYGQATDISDLVKYCHENGVKVIEDCAQSLGADIGGVKAGLQGDAGTTSFYPTKNLGALGDAGAIFSNSTELLTRARQLRQYGWGSKYNVIVEGGVNSRLDEIQAAILNLRIDNLDIWNEKRREIIRRYKEATLDSKRINILSSGNKQNSGHLAVAIANERNSVMQELNSLGVITDVHYPFPDYSQTGLSSKSPGLPITDWAANHVFSLPCFPEMTEQEVEQVCKALGTL